METYLVHQLHDGRFVLLGVQGAYAGRAATFESGPEAEAFAAWLEGAMDIPCENDDTEDNAEREYASGYEQALYDLEDRAHENGNSALAKEIAEMGEALLCEQREEEDEEDAEEPACENCYYASKSSDEEPCKSCSFAHVSNYRPAERGNGIEDSRVNRTCRNPGDCISRPASDTPTVTKGNEF